MIARELDTIVARHDLNAHPFYRAWQAGTLPAAALAAYADEYAAFIDCIELGWRALGRTAHAAVEKEHASMWRHFQGALQGALPRSGGAPPCPEVRALVDEARRSFSDPVDAAGVLYAFEAQQPATARSKLDGLVSFYGLSGDAIAYFREHADDYGERDELGAVIDALPAADRARAAEACERACRAMWSALDGVMRVAT